ncbi:unnamed protein product, partial [Rotaria sp. Silwood2]
MESSNPNEDDSNKENTNIQVILAKIKLKQTELRIIQEEIEKGKIQLQLNEQEIEKGKIQLQLNEEEIEKEKRKLQVELERNKRLENATRLTENKDLDFKVLQVVQGTGQGRRRPRSVSTKSTTKRRKTDNKGFSSSTNQSTTSINSQSATTSLTNSQSTSTISTCNQSTATSAQSRRSSSEYELCDIKDNGDYYWKKMYKNLHTFKIESLLTDDVCLLNNDSYNDNIEECIKIYLQDIKQCIINRYENFVSFDQMSENILQQAVNNLMSELLKKFNNLTSLQYLNTSKKKYLGGNSPDCSFIYKNVSIHDKSITKVLVHFLVCFGELKLPIMGDIHVTMIGQIGRYFENLNIMQGCRICYAFLYDFHTITFFYCDKISDKDDLQYYQSETLQLIEFEHKERSNLDAITMDEVSKEIIYFNKENWKIFIKFLTMKWQFYQCNILNISPDDDLFGQDYEIKERLGSGATSIVYF